jgi:hypothetical protein
MRGNNRYFLQILQAPSIRTLVSSSTFHLIALQQRIWWSKYADMLLLKPYTNWSSHEKLLWRAQSFLQIASFEKLTLEHDLTNFNLRSSKLAFNLLLYDHNMEMPQPHIFICSQFSILLMLWRLEMNLLKGILERIKLHISKVCWWWVHVSGMIVIVIITQQHTHKYTCIKLLVCVCVARETTQITLLIWLK